MSKGGGDGGRTVGGNFSEELLLSGAKPLTRARDRLVLATRVTLEANRFCESCDFSITRQGRN